MSYQKRGQIEDVFRTIFSKYSSVLIKVLESVEKNDIGSLNTLCSSLATVSSSCQDLSLERFCDWAIRREVTKSLSSETLFRANTVGTKLVGSGMQIYGSKYLKFTMKEFIENTVEMVQKEGVPELDPMKLGDSAMQLKANVETLSKLVTQCLRVIFQSRGSAPKTIKHWCRILRRKTETRFQAEGRKAVGGLIFLRFICPVIVAPPMTWFDDPNFIISTDARRTLVLIGKVIQNMANDVMFGEKEPFMVAMNPLMREKQGEMNSFLDSWTSSDSTLGMNRAVSVGRSPPHGPHSRRPSAAAVQAIRAFSRRSSYSKPSIDFGDLPKRAPPKSENEEIQESDVINGRQRSESVNSSSVDNALAFSPETFSDDCFEKNVKIVRGWLLKYVEIEENSGMEEKEANGKAQSEINIPELRSILESIVIKEKEETPRKKSGSVFSRFSRVGSMTGRGTAKNEEVPRRSYTTVQKPNEIPAKVEQPSRSVSSGPKGISSRFGRRKSSKPNAVDAAISGKADADISVPSLWAGSMTKLLFDRNDVVVVNYVESVDGEEKELNANQLSFDLFLEISAVIGGHTLNDGTIGWPEISASDSFAAFEKKTSRLALIDIEEETKEQSQLSFFINLYNILACHIMSRGISPYWSGKRRQFFSGFAYQIGFGETHKPLFLTLDAIEQAILRGSHRACQLYGIPMKLAIQLDTYDRALIQFGLIRLGKNDPVLRVFKPGLEVEELRFACAAYLQSIVSIRKSKSEISLPKIIDIYGEDMGQTDQEKLAFVFQFLDDEQKIILAAAMSEKKLPKISYISYKWGESIQFSPSAVGRRGSRITSTSVKQLSRTDLVSMRTHLLNDFEIMNPSAMQKFVGRHACEISMSVLGSLEQIYLEYLEVTAPLSYKEMDWDQLKRSKSFLSVLGASYELREVSVAPLNDIEKTSFFVNAYNFASFCATILAGGPPKSKNEQQSRLREYGLIIGSYPYSLDMIESGVLCGNPKNKLSRHRVFRGNDNRRAVVLPPPVDPRIALSLSNATIGTSPIEILKMDQIDEQLDRNCEVQCSQVRIDKSRVSLPKAFDHSLFHSHPETDSAVGLLRFVAKYLGETDARKEEIIGLIGREKSPKIKIVYQDDWTPRLAVFASKAPPLYNSS